MNYLLSIIFILISVFGFSQSQDKSNLDKYGKKLVGTWKCDGIEIINQNSNIYKSSEEIPETTKERVNKLFDEVYKQMIDTMIFCTYIFNENSTMETIFPHKSVKGKWHISKDGKELTIKENDAKADIKLPVQKISRKKLVFYSEKEDIKIKIVFFKLKK